MAGARIPSIITSLPFAPASVKSSRIPHLAFALSSKHAGRLAPSPSSPQKLRRNASTTSRPPSSIPSLPARPRLTTTPPTISPTAATTSTRSRTTYLYAICLFGAVTGIYTFYYVSSYLHAPSVPLTQNADVSSRWDDPTRDYDEEIEFSERAMFMGRKRRRLLGGGDGLVEGKVLEVSCGTGRNFEWYDFERNAANGKGRGGITEVVFNDRSAVQLGIARTKWEALQRGRREKGKGGAFDGPVKGVVGDAGVEGVVRRPEGGFDTIVQTMGICSMQEPVAFLRRMNFLARQPGEGKDDEERKKTASPNSSKKEVALKNEEQDLGGRILLLEHGRGHYDWLNRFLDQGAPMHADRYGCWYNKDILEVVKESGLKVERVKRYHLGTTWELVLRPNPALLTKKEVGKIHGGNHAQVGATTAMKQEEQKHASASWWRWLSWRE